MDEEGELRSHLTLRLLRVAGCRWRSGTHEHGVMRKERHQTSKNANSVKFFILHRNGDHEAPRQLNTYSRADPASWWP
jgi:hypothetical protein